MFCKDTFSRKWILAPPFLGIIFYQPPAGSSENHLQVQLKKFIES